MATEFRIEGSVIGGLWWPIGEPATKAVSMRFVSGEYPTLRDAVDSLTMREGGDFSTAARLTADSVLIATRQHGRRTVSRFFDLTAASSIADYMSDEYPFSDEDD
jgi:hypothetical protein